jgi:hypothetical protein
VCVKSLSIVGLESVFHAMFLGARTIPAFSYCAENQMNCRHSRVLPQAHQRCGTLVFDLETIGESQIGIGQRSTVLLARH